MLFQVPNLLMSDNTKSDKNNYGSHSKPVAERLRHLSREQRVPSSSPAWTSVLR